MKFKIKDEDGRNYEIEEIETNDDDITEVSEIEAVEEEELTPEDISTLKKLIEAAPKLIKLLAVEEKEHAENPELVDEDMVEDEEEEIAEVEDEDEEEETEQILETKTHDSKKSIGSLESKKATKLDDSLDCCSVEKAWAKRYGGNV